MSKTPVSHRPAIGDYSIKVPVICVTQIVTFTIGRDKIP